MALDTGFETASKPRVKPGGQKGDSPLHVGHATLCTRCGTCYAVCARGAISFDARSYPRIDSNRCNGCGLCEMACPGLGFDFKEGYRREFSVDGPPTNAGRIYLEAFLGFSLDPQVRRQGSGGAVATQALISALRMGYAQAAVVVGASPDNPTIPLPMVARTEEEVRAAAQSRYCVVSVNNVLKDLLATGERFVFVGLPCHVHGLRKLQAINPRLREATALIIGLVCHSTLEQEAAADLLKRRGIEPSTVKRLFYRGGEAPGAIHVELTDGHLRRLHRHNIKEGAFNYLYRLYCPSRCRLCVDYSNEFADIALSDAWVRDQQGEYLSTRAVTMVLVRTQRGLEFIKRLEKENQLSLEPVSEEMVRLQHEKVERKKKALALAGCERLRRKGLDHPQYGLEIPKASAGERVGILLRDLTYVLGRKRWFRKLAMFVFFSWLWELAATPYIKFKKVRSKWKTRGIPASLYPRI